ncbi:hypothetical protein J3458_001569 [Metarhizium acridum]|uniref:uncharacterized protein n=1 Tax=Metarhizium acridum TaxID=92637 RepID=UPI001C6BB070|nr:hypothetical protein J3458_001569 [Metarhizium acridum]
MATIERGHYVNTGKILNELRHEKLLRTYCNSLDYRPLELAIAKTDMLTVKLLLDVTGWSVEDHFLAKARTPLMTHYLEQKKTEQAQNQDQATREANWNLLLTPFGFVEFTLGL